MGMKVKIEDEFVMNKDWEKRNELLDINEGDWLGGIASFRNLSSKKLEKLIKLKFADPEECQNDSPSIREFLVFLKRNPNFRAHGYAVSHNRNDYRVSIEGVEKGSALTPKEMKDFVECFRYADEFDLDIGRAWYD